MLSATNESFSETRKHPEGIAMVAMAIGLLVLLGVGVDGLLKATTTLVSYYRGKY